MRRCRSGRCRRLGGRSAGKLRPGGPDTSGRLSTSTSLKFLVVVLPNTSRNSSIELCRFFNDFGDNPPLVLRHLDCTSPNPVRVQFFHLQRPAVQPDVFTPSFPPRRPLLSTSLERVSGITPPFGTTSTCTHVLFDICTSPTKTPSLLPANRVLCPRPRPFSERPGRAHLYRPLRAAIASCGV